MKEKYADILFPLALERLLTYRVPEDLCPQPGPGCQVTAPVGNRIHTGVVYRIGEEPPQGGPKDSLRDIISVVPSLPLIPEKTLMFWEWIARYYMCPPGLVAKMALGLWKFKRRAKGPATDPKPFPDPGPPLYLEGMGRETVYRKNIGMALDRGGQCLIVCPDRFSCESVHQFMLDAFGEKAICFHSKRPLKEQSKAQKELYAGNPCVVTGMHLALLLPFTRPALVVVEREEHPAHKKSESVPYLNARDTALMMGQQFHAQVILGSALPSLETLYNIEKGKFTALEHIPAALPMPEKNVLIDTAASLTTGTMRGALDLRTLAAVENCLAEQKKILFAEAGPSFPEDLPQDTGILVCRPFQTHHHLDSSIGLVCFLHTERLLSRKHFRATEQACHIMANVLRWAAVQTPRVPVMIQSSYMDHPFYRFVREGLPASFMDDILQERIRYGYPPHTRQILITIFHHRKNLAADRSRALCRVLDSASLPARIEGPFVPPERRELLFSYRLQVTIQRTVNAQPVKERISSLIRQAALAPARIRVDVDPA